jgi:hypothetical protein
VILCVLFWQAPFTGDRQILIIVRAAAFQSVDVLNNPEISRPQLAPALVAAAFLLSEHPRPPLWRHAPALVVFEGVSHFPSPSNRDGVHGEPT